ncbi:helix-turn-helix transcriptional regulator [Clostridium culturomicium]|uniref:helix-turn-helix transcriptional regulator n=1 Tax=Clostridium culturomicium TaxID=1499683 RepID=UPI00058AC694|nr:PAS domain-containing protein [Clostridium culturomicium]
MRDIMEHYEKLVHFLGNVLSPNCEIALLDLRDNKNCITAIVNGHISGRTVGAPITNLALQVISTNAWQETDSKCNYLGLTKDNNHLRSSSYFIKDNNELIGMLCINIDVTPYDQLNKAVSQIACSNYAEAPLQLIDSLNLNHEKFTNNLSDTIDAIFKENVDLSAIPISRLTQDEKIAIVGKLYENGVFHLKGAVANVAEHLHCSEATIYRYLNKIIKEHNS